VLSCRVKRGAGKENGEEGGGTSGGSFLAGGERKGGVAGLAWCHMEKGSGEGPGGGGLANWGRRWGVHDTGRWGMGG
jgi:hypothetical protein